MLALGIHNMGVTWADLCFRMFIPTEYNRSDWSQGDPLGGFAVIPVR